jgi:hypothetical protein
MWAGLVSNSASRPDAFIRAAHLRHPFQFFYRLPAPAIQSIDFPKIELSPSYFSQLCVQPFRLGHKLQFLIEKGFFLVFDDAPCAASTIISAG